ncbi:hypothetical protein [Mesoplasma whartonense]|uniref:hypothetical protein n=1 Tax=Mesoplasma whartonense TaxID=2878854 RepID=UPI002022B5F4|nr:MULTISPECIES: hypothetical protein [unclassified Mesoplasma]MCL8212490.1 hypothetical protein [Mesoplasma sp. JKS002661]MCL8215912.1 hypothetical protein [Mesoplasma sp. JKS002657]
MKKTKKAKPAKTKKPAKKVKAKKTAKKVAKPKKATKSKTKKTKVKASKADKKSKKTKSKKSKNAKGATAISASTKAQVNLVEHPVLKIKPITNLSSEEQHQVLENLRALAKSQTTFADKYYVLDSGLVVMIATSKKDIRGIKKYLRR